MASRWLLIDDDPRRLSEVGEPLVLGDRLGLLGLHVRNHGEHDEAALLSRNDEVLRKTRPGRILAGGEAPEHDIAIDEFAGPAGSKLAAAILGVGRDHGGGDVQSLQPLAWRND